MRIAYTNLVDGGTVTANSEDPQFVDDNVQDQRLAKAWRTLSTTGITCVVDLATAQTVNTVAVLGHNITTAATVTIQANASDSWGAPTYSTTLTALDGAILRYLDSAETFRYWRYTFEDPTNTENYLQIGRLWLGDFLQIDPSSTVDFTVSKKRNDVVSYGRGLQKFGTPGVGWREFNFEFRRHEATMLTAIQTMYDTVGNHTSMIFCNFDTLRTYPIVEPCYVSIVGDIDFKHRRSMAFDYSLRLEEDL
jgi:hypothetical protein